MAHWTERSPDDFLYRIASDFVTQLENKIEAKSLTQAQLAEKLGVSKGRVSQLLNNPGNLTLKMMIKCARVLGLKITIVAYDDDDQKNERGPINSEIFRMCWENSGKPLDFWSLTRPQAVVTICALGVAVPQPIHGISDFPWPTLENGSCRWDGSQIPTAKDPIMGNPCDEVTISPLN